MIKSWLADHIATTTGAPAGAGNLRAEKCRSCGVVVLAGLSSQQAGFSVQVDPQPLSPVGEAMALLVGRWTFALRMAGNHFRLTTRDQWQIKGSPAGSAMYVRTDVVAQHACNAPQLPGLPSTHRRPVKPVGEDLCPF